MELRTERLRIVPLTLTQFALFLEDLDKLERALGLQLSHTVLDTYTKQAMAGLYQEALAHQESMVWYTNWQIILKMQNISIGSACFMGAPGKSGEVEIGYGIDEAYRNKGYMTEAVKALCQWALRQPKVACVVAETEKDNPASHKVLQNCGMEQYKEADGNLWWRFYPATDS